MKILTLLGLTFVLSGLIFGGCGTLTPEEMQQERFRLIEAYNEARQRHNPEKVKEAVKDLLVGKWRYVGLEVEEENIITKMAKSSPQEALKSVSSLMEKLSKGATGEQAETSDALEQETASPNSPNPEADEQTSETDAPRLPRIEVTDEKSSQQILAAKVALVASTRQNLTVEFFHDRGTYNYSGSNGGKHVTGQCYITTQQYGDDPFPFIRFNQRTGPEMLAFLFGSEPVKQIAAKQKQKRVAMMRNRNMGIHRARRAASKKTSFAIASLAGITVTEDRLYLILYGDVELISKGWIRTGGLRCTFKRIE